MPEIRVSAGSRSVGTGANRDRQELATAVSKCKKARGEPGLDAMHVPNRNTSTSAHGACEVFGCQAERVWHIQKRGLPVANQ
jgi:hypothetical protein